MKIFISHKFRGVNKAELKKKLEKIASVFESKGHQIFIYFRNKENWKPKKFPPGKVIKEAFEEIRKCDAILGFIDQKKLSEGMFLEFGFAKALNKKTILLIAQKCSCPTLEAISDNVIKFNNLSELKNKLNKFKLE